MYQATLMSCGTAKHDCTHIYVYIYIYIFEYNRASLYRKI